MKAKTPNRKSKRFLLAPLAALGLLVASAGAQAGVDVKLPLAGVHADRGATAAHTVRAGYHRRDARHDEGHHYGQRRGHDNRSHSRGHDRHESRFGWHNNRRDNDHRRAERGRHDWRHHSQRGNDRHHSRWNSRDDHRVERRDHDRGWSHSSFGRR